VRLTKDKKTKENKGFAFVTFNDKDAAQHAVEDVQDREYKVLRLTKMLNLLHNLHGVCHSAMYDVLTCQGLVVQGGTLRCSLSQAKHRLFVGNVPKGLSEEELTNIIKGKGPGAVNIEMFKVRSVILWQFTFCTLQVSGSLIQRWCLSGSAGPKPEPWFPLC
jgi:heterogeneous nuclear ribonucleoprotein R